MSDPDFQPTLTGPTVIVRPIAASDWTELFKAGSDPQIWKGHPDPDRCNRIIVRILGGDVKGPPP